MISSSSAPALRLGRSFPLGLVTLGAFLAFAGVLVVAQPVVVALVVPLLAGGMLLALLIKVLFISEPALRAKVTRWTFASVGLHLAVGLITVNLPSAANYLGPDAFTYHFDAMAIVDHWTQGAPLPVQGAGKEGFAYALGSLYLLLGPHTVAGLALNACLGAALVPLLTDTTNRLFGPSVAGRLPVLVVLLPGLLIWPSQLLREASALFLVAVCVAAVVRLGRRTTLKPIFVLALAISLLFAIRAPVALCVLAGLGAGAMMRKRFMGSLVVQGFVTLLVVGIVLVIGLGSSGYTYAVESNLEDAAAFREGTRAEAGSGLEEADISTPGGFTAHLPIAIARFYLGPFPWEIRSVSQAPAVVDLLAWLWLTPKFLRGVRVGWKQHGRLPALLLALALVLTIVLAPVVGNYGLLLRERTQVLVVILPFVAMGLAKRGASADAEVALSSRSIGSAA